ncbi:NTP transferase domain-containing protein [Bacteriovorax sp. Seq25_V]|uniref:NTP transferase domain-containing protein n=1 Tax=Bacteriovorax sp. Seq25_V TaxID=1201288 RepID=UPI000389F261|nr:NTP transferase domain-containing protein [Bacteriovorax sp. Seq25_V]EQC46882.1 MobA-like NTP transferase domain protein [Bacteriovorax sp. Seq25_V]
MTSVIIPISQIHQDCLTRLFLNKTIFEHIKNNFPEKTNFYSISQEVDQRISGTININVAKNNKGPLQTIESAISHLSIDENDEVFIHYSDLLVLFDYKKFKSTIDSTKDTILFISKHQTPFRLDSQDYSFVKNVSGQKIQIGHKKSFTQIPHSEDVSCGLYYFKTFKLLKDFIKKSISLNHFHTESIFDQSDIQKETYGDVINLELDSKSKIRLFENWYHYFDVAKISEQRIPDIEYIVPLAGKGSRFASANYATPKHLLPIEDMTLIEFTAGHVKEAKKYHFITLDDKADYLDRFKPLALRKILTPTEGQACSVYEAVKHIADDSEILVGVCDNCAEFDIEAFNKLKVQSDVIYFSFTNHPNMMTRPEHYGWLKTDNQNMVTGVSVKTPISKTPLKDQAIVGLFYFKKALMFKKAYQELLNQCDKINGEYYVDSLVPYLIKENLKVSSFPVKHFISLGTPNEYESFFYFKSCYQELSSR